MLPVVNEISVIVRLQKKTQINAIIVWNCLAFAKFFFCCYECFFSLFVQSEKILLYCITRDQLCPAKFVANMEICLFHVFSLSLFFVESNSYSWSIKERCLFTFVLHVTDQRISESRKGERVNLRENHILPEGSEI